MIKHRLAEPRSAKHDLYSFAADQLSQEDIWSEAAVFLIGGGDTVATAMTALFFYMARNRECYRKLAEEIRSSFKMRTQIKGGAKLTSCKYLRACIDECLRMSPPLASTLWREQRSQDSGNIVVDGHMIPRGTRVGVNTYSLHHNPTYFPEPFKFWPERWLASRDENRTSREAFAPFSTGSRGCAGKAMAYLEISLVMATTLWDFDFEEAPVKGAMEGGIYQRFSYQTSPEFQLHDVFVSSHDGPYLIFRPRTHSVT
ncbi:uncharacterized protein JN550_012877 [Neoarthrinium moseri]|uniref:uncharacterized protein n=1 Tax=Neoarthrinium moseri TaxID=1658444 RepID=UPI001FDD7DD1|nr:uncharacterized protein JN550_012877 [Neoarthrinium moseri]KAI1858055.1 hypothetical protein JN550_012877 [Neoarthrinium moseri]